MLSGPSAVPLSVRHDAARSLGLLIVALPSINKPNVEALLVWLCGNCVLRTEVAD